MAAIEAEGLVKFYRSRKSEMRALDGVDLEVQQGTVLGLLGPNGAGKTTTVRILTTLLRPGAGTARVGGLDVVRDAQAVRRSIALSGQYAAVDEPVQRAHGRDARALRQSEPVHVRLPGRPSVPALDPLDGRAARRLRAARGAEVPLDRPPRIHSLGTKSTRSCC